LALPRLKRRTFQSTPEAIPEFGIVTVYPSWAIVRNANRESLSHFRFYKGRSASPHILGKDDPWEAVSCPQFATRGDAKARLVIFEL
jgi:hypothetical protein